MLTLNQASAPAKHSPGDFGEAALAYYEKAAREGQATAAITLAEMYSAGKGLPVDVGSSYVWNLIASEQLIEARSSLTKTMTREELREAEQKAADWLASVGKKRSLFLSMISALYWLCIDPFSCWATVAQ